MVDEAEVAAIADVLAEKVEATLVAEYSALHDLLEGQHDEFKAFVEDMFRAGLDAAKSIDDQRAWNEDVRALSVALMARAPSPVNPKEQMIYAIVLADQIAQARKERQKSK